MHQLDIQFFWPLTEQIPLELDYEDCDTRPKINIFNSTTAFQIAPSNWTIRPVLQIEPDAITLRMNKPVPWYRKMLYKLLGMNVEEK